MENRFLTPGKLPGFGEDGTLEAIKQIPHPAKGAGIRDDKFVLVRGRLS
jgi:hypothetical protein